MVASIMYVHNNNTTNMSWKDRVKSRIKDMKSRFVRSRYYKPVKVVAGVLGLAAGIAAYYTAVYATAYFVVVALLAMGANPAFAMIVGFWMAIVVAVAILRGLLYTLEVVNA